MTTRSPWLRLGSQLALIICLAQSAIAADSSQAQASQPSIQTLTMLLAGNQPQSSRQAAAEQAAVMLLTRQNLHSLDPDNRLGAEGTKAVTARLTRDIRPVVHQVFASLPASQWRHTLAQALQENLNQQGVDRLLVYLRSPAGQQYLAFNRALDQLVGEGLSQMTSTPISIQRDQMPAPELMKQRQQLLAMSTNVRQLRHAHPSGSPAALGVICDLLAVQRGAALDQLARQYGKSLPAFAAFQQSEEGQALSRALWRWSNLQSSNVEASLHQAASDLASQQADWQALTRQWLNEKK
ncbi:MULTISPECIES: hypothetical protein [unclassified Paludibacterium]|uniref:hypothetical protein n=1 Tax=unclassified Paludibacterium TaxID=2618429 RepID=UPI001C051CE3|nr:hypothetical protein [Paludibacterium sp. B53371]BEV71750.1 hypothetical protein THUN1379_12320 [Paludibacterium sp. THUN1379]